MTNKFISLITQNILNEISSKDELAKEISEYKANSAKIDKLQKSIEETLKQIKSQSDEEKKRLTLIIKYMEDFKVIQSEGDDWVANLEQVPAFKYPSASYKELWEEAMSKLNDATKKVLKGFENAHLDAKRKATKPELKITDKPKDVKENKNKEIQQIEGRIKEVKENIIYYKNLKQKGKGDITDISNNIYKLNKELKTLEDQLSSYKSLKENIIDKGLQGLTWLKNLLFGIKEFNYVVNNLPTISSSLVKENKSKQQIKQQILNKIKEITREIDSIVLSGGRIELNDPLSIELTKLLKKIRTIKEENETSKPNSYMLSQFEKFAMIQKDGKFLKGFNPLEWTEDPNKGMVFEPGMEVYHARKDATTLGATLVWVSDLKEEEKGQLKLKKGTSERDIKKYTDQGIDVEIDEIKDTNYPVLVNIRAEKNKPKSKNKKDINYPVLVNIRAEKNKPKLENKKDINDPVLTKIRAEKNKPKPENKKSTGFSTEKLLLVDKLEKKLISLLGDRNDFQLELEQVADVESGKFGKEDKENREHLLSLDKDIKKIMDNLKKYYEKAGLSFPDQNLDSKIKQAYSVIGSELEGLIFEAKRYHHTNPKNNHIFGFGQWWFIDDAKEELEKMKNDINYQVEAISGTEEEMIDSFERAIKEYEKTGKPQVCDYYKNKKDIGFSPIDSEVSEAKTNKSGNSFDRLYKIVKPIAKKTGGNAFDLDANQSTVDVYVDSKKFAIALDKEFKKLKWKSRIINLTDDSDNDPSSWVVSINANDYYYGAK